MITLAIFVTLSLFSLGQVDSAKQQVQLSDSYLPVAMQIISHITDQMAFDVKDTTPRPTTKPTPRPTTKPTTRPTPRPTTRPTTSRPYVTYKPINSWWSGFTTKRLLSALYIPIAFSKTE